MTVFAACAIAGAAVAVDSNIVGYTTKGVAASQKTISGAQFVEVGEAGLELSSIKLENVDMDGGVVIQWWNGSGYDRAAWVEKNWGDGVPWWGDESDWEVEITHTFAPGEGFWVQMPGGVSGATVTQSGEVAVDNVATFDFDLAASTKYLMINPLPTELNLSDITIVNADMDGGVVIQWWNGSSYDRAAWVEKNWGDGVPWWGDETDWEVEITHTFNPTEGFWVQMPGGVSNPQIKFVNKVIL